MALFSGTPTTVRTLEIIAGCACRMATFSGTSTTVNTSGISVVFAYKMALFSGNAQGSESCKSEAFEPACDFGILGLQSSHLDAMQLRRGYSPTSMNFRHSPISVPRISFVLAHNVVYSAWFSVSILLCVRGSILPGWRWLRRWRWGQRLAMRGSCYGGGTRNW